ncbi:flagellar hook assembly protein FlgD [Aquabacter cavernae]|uniref:flagellar hook assembly protein FlgD n=1 Tax=Aquabacter cavernae TaxID=2496029 RepID=UPI000F8F4F3A|nr:flagellar hook assembly protein FlgD [Aquabacter cavernae]
MTTVSSLNSNAASNSSAGSATSKTVDYDAFLQLLIAQMKNQDPTSPMDSSEYMSQLASFSQVEQGVATNKKLDTLLASNAVENAASFIGKTLTSADGTVTGEVASVKTYSDATVATLTSGKEVVLETGISVA